MKKTSNNIYNRRRFLKVVGAGVAAVGLTPILSRVKTEKRKPNILFILMDDMGWKDVGFMGSDFYETPNIDRLAREGVVFTQAYANAPNCAPTRACIMSGQYTPRHGVYTVGTSARGSAKHRKLIPIENNTILASTYTTLAEAMKSAGYATFHGGKWHLGEGAETGPEGQGFDVNIGGCSKGSPPGGYFAPWKAPHLESAPKGAHLCDYITDHALSFITENKDKPFFLYLPFYDVHTPLQAKKKLIEKYQRKKEQNEAKGITTQHNHPTYAAMVENTDANIGRVLRKLEELDLVQDTVVVFFSDNGGFGGATNMRPLRGCKGMLYEGGIREPMIVKWPGTIKAGRKCATPVIGIDFYPTFLEMAGATKPTNQVLDGQSLMPLLLNTGELKRETLFWHFPCYLQNVPKGYQQDSHDGRWRTTPCSVVRQGDWKLLELLEDGALELYNLKDDIGERKNLVKEKPEKTKELHALLKRWRESVNAPVPTERNPKYKPL
jgi:arylsulfatase A-like enzyme